MRKQFTRIGFLILLVATIFAGSAISFSSARAALASCAPTCYVESVDPNSIANTADRIITVRGNFNGITDPLVSLQGYGILVTTKVNDGVLTAAVPAGIPGNVNGKNYDVHVLDDVGDDLPPKPPSTEYPKLTVKSPASAEPTQATETPEPTNYIRPLVVVLNYGISQVGPVRPGQTFAIEVNLINTGQLPASNVVVTFFPGDFEPRETGGIRSQGTLQPGQTTKIIQTLTAKPDLEGGLGLLDIEIRYTDEFGTAYSDKARITIDVLVPTQAGGSGPGATRTPTPGALNRPQFVISGYNTDVETLQPGTQFTLQLDVVNRGTETAKAVSMIVGGGSSSGDGTPGAGGGVSGGSGEFTNFSPINSSNVQFIGDVPAAGSLVATQQLIVNSSTAPGAYSLKISFVYTDTQGSSYTDDQVITLLVLKPPRVDISFYTPAGPLFAGQPGMLPIQVVNLGNASTILGQMTVTSDGADLTNNTLLVGNVDPGFPITLDVQAMPFEVGTLTAHVSIEYVDDFNQTRTLEKDLTVEVIEGFPVEPIPGEGEGEGFPPEEIPAEPETVWELLMRFISGLLGLGSERQQPGFDGSFDGGVPPDGGFPGEEVPLDAGGGEGGIVVPVPSK